MNAKLTEAADIEHLIRQMLGTSIAAAILEGPLFYKAAHSPS